MAKLTKLTKVMLWMFYLPLLIDLIGTYIVFWKEGHSLSEANPIFIAVKGNHFLFLMIVLLICGIWYYVITAKQHSPTYRFLILTVLVFTILTRGFAVYGHIMHLLHPVSIEVAQTAAIYQPAAKVSFYNQLVGLLIFLPLLMQWIILKLFQIDYDIVKKVEK